MDINDRNEELLQQQALDGDISAKHLTFQIDSRYFGIPISNVIEIVQIQPITPMPELPPYAKGIINMRGRVIPVIDVNVRFGNAEREHTERTCIIIEDIDGQYIGFIVDGVDEVLDIEQDKISPPPAFSSDGSINYITGIGKMEKHMVLLLDSRRLLSDSDIALNQ